jgi:NAD(P)H-hydrate repair Nnr-like enzyme with NAD(P)H-hydrate dehydratase domain
LTTRLAQRLGAVICMKGAGTLICDGLHMWSTTRGNAALATAGSGDILAVLLYDPDADVRAIRTVRTESR